MPRIENNNIPIILLFLITESMFLSLPLGTSTDIQYLLSAMSQALAALFALVFTIVLVVSQMASIHSHRLVDSVFGKATKFYMTFFALAVITPFIALKTQYYRVVFVWISGTLAIICIIYLIPFMFSVKENLKIESLLISTSRKSAEKVKSSLQGKYKEYKLSKTEQDEFWEEIRIIDNIALSAWNRKDYDTFQIAISRLLWIVTEIKNWHTIQEIRIRLEEIGRDVVKDIRASKIVLDSIRDVLPLVTTDKKNYPLRGLLEDYCDLSIDIAINGHLISSNHSLTSYYEIGKEILKRKNEELATSLVEDFFRIFWKARHQEFPNMNCLSAIGSIGLQSAKLGFESTTRKFLELIIASDAEKIKKGQESFFRYFLGPVFKTIDLIEIESEKRSWKDLVGLCKLYRTMIFKETHLP
jgi:hypothetical protein